MGLKIKAEEKAQLKGQGFLLQRDGEHFSVRLLTEDGNFTTAEATKAAELAAKYGHGYLSYTTRLSVEIPWVKYEDIEALKQEIVAGGLTVGGTGPRVRPVVACKGTVCVYGLLDTQACAREIHQRFYKGYYDVKLPHKFKIGIGGCPNNCIKPDLNDFGMMGQCMPKLDESLCEDCKKCGVVAACRANAVRQEDGLLQIDREKCMNCGVCLSKCHFSAMKAAKEGVKIFLGGKWGKTGKPGQVLAGIYSLVEAMDILEKSILYYRENGKPKERFGEMIERLGLAVVTEAILGEEILARKADILKG